MVLFLIHLLIFDAQTPSYCADFAMVSQVPNICDVFNSIFSTFLPVEDVFLCLYSSFFNDTP